MGVNEIPINVELNRHWLFGRMGRIQTSFQFLNAGTGDTLSNHEKKLYTMNLAAGGVHQNKNKFKNNCNTLIHTYFVWVRRKCIVRTCIEHVRKRIK